MHPRLLHPFFFLRVRTIVASRLPSRPHGGRFAPAHPTPARGTKSDNPRSSIRRFHSGPRRVGQNAIWPRYASCSDYLPIHADTCLCDHHSSLPRPNDARCHYSALPSFLSKIPHRRHQPRPPCPPALPILHLASYTSQAFLLTLFCFLARCVRCWARIRANDAEQAPMDCQDRPQAWVARSETQARGSCLDQQAAHR